MIESGYYPPGAEFDPNAPWNQHDIEEVVKPINYSCALRRTADVATDNYIPGGIEREWDGEGYYAFREPDDFSDTEWLKEFHKQFNTPLQLIQLLHETALSLAKGELPAEKRKGFWRSIAFECEGWQIEDEDAELND